MFNLLPDNVNVSLGNWEDSWNDVPVHELCTWWMSFRAFVDPSFGHIDRLHHLSEISVKGTAVSIDTLLEFIHGLFFSICNVWRKVIYRKHNRNGCILKAPCFFAFRRRSCTSTCITCQVSLCVGFDSFCKSNNLLLGSMYLMINLHFHIISLVINGMFTSTMEFNCISFPCFRCTKLFNS
jgi:hypothetical protein